MWATYTASLVSIGQSKLKLLSRNGISILVTVTLTLITDTWVAIPRCILMKATHTLSLVSIGQSKLKLLSGNCISIFSNSDLDLDHRHMGSNPKLRRDVSYPYSKFGVNRSKQTKVIERKPKVDARTPTRPPAHPPAADFSITITSFRWKPG